MKYRYIRKPRKCPECGSNRIARVMYGMPEYSEKMAKEIDEKRLILGGCCVTEDDPPWQCVDCDIGLYKKSDKESILSPEEYIPSKLKLFIGGYMGSSYLVELRDDKLIYSEFVELDKLCGEKEISLTEDSWINFRCSIDDLEIWSWEERYPNPGMMDGTMWSVVIEYKDNKINSRGDNNYPEYFDYYLKIVKKLIGGEVFE